MYNSSSDEEFDPMTATRRLKQYKKKSSLKGDVAVLFGKANTAYTFGDFSLAISLLSQVSSLAPSRPEPFKTLSLVYDALKQPRKAIAALLMAAVKGKETSRWLELADSAIKYDFPVIESYAVGRALISAPNDVSLHIRRARILIKLGKRSELSRAVNHLAAAHNFDPKNVEILVELVHLLIELERLDICKNILEKSILYFHSLNPPESPDFRILNYFCELSMSEGHFQSVHTLLLDSARIGLTDNQSDPSPSELLQVFPPDLTSKLLVSFFYLSLPIDESALSIVLSWDIHDYVDLYEFIATAALTSDQYSLFSFFSLQFPS
ncbi:hypothetical protein GEMRC1_007990 [Eukaryota sp. GEM-RC1]